MELEALQELQTKFEAKGASIVALCPQRIEHNQSLVKEHGFRFPVLTDFNNQVATAFGLTLPTPQDVIDAEQFLGLDLPEHNGTNHWDLPMPSRFVINSDGIIVYASINADHTMRADPQDCLRYVE